MHTLFAVIGFRGAVKGFADRWHRARLVELPRGFAMVPLTPALCEDIEELAGLNQAAPWEIWLNLSRGVSEAIRQASLHGPLACIKTEYFAGWGEQWSAVWAQGKVVLGPVWTGEDAAVSEINEWAINQALRYLGLRPDLGRDCFDTLGLGYYQKTEAAAVRAPLMKKE